MNKRIEQLEEALQDEYEKEYQKILRRESKKTIRVPVSRSKKRNPMIESMAWNMWARAKGF